MRCAPTSRRFKDDPVPAEILARALGNPASAPSGGNRQGWRVIVVRDAQRARRHSAELYLATVARLPRADRREGPTDAAVSANAFDPARVRTVRRADGYAQSLAEVPVHLVVGVRLDDLAVTDAGLPRQSIVGGASIYPFAQNLLLALRAEGLGAAMTTLLVPAEADVRRLLGIPEEVALAAQHRRQATAPTRGRRWARAKRGRGVRVRRDLRTPPAP